MEKIDELEYGLASLISGKGSPLSKILFFDIFPSLLSKVDLLISADYLNLSGDSHSKDSI